MMSGNGESFEGIETLYDAFIRCSSIILTKDAPPSEMPKTIVLRIAKGTIPDNAKLAKEVPSALQKASTVFISYLASHAHDIAIEKKQKTLAVPHVLEAIRQLHWGDEKELELEMIEELEHYRATPSKKRSTISKKASLAVGVDNGRNMVEASAQETDGPDEAVAVSDPDATEWNDDGEDDHVQDAQGGHDGDNMQDLDD